MSMTDYFFSCDTYDPDIGRRSTVWEVRGPLTNSMAVKQSRLSSNRINCNPVTTFYVVLGLLVLQLASE